MSLLTDRPPTAAHCDPNVLRWLGAYTASVTGDLVYFVALSWAAARTGGPLEAGIILAAGSVPRALLMLGGGVVADRFGPRRVVIGSDFVRCVLIFAAAATIFFGQLDLWLLVGLALAFGTVDALFMPAVGALPAAMTTADQFSRVQGLRMLGVRVSNAIGPVVAAVALVGGAAGAFGVSGVLFALSLVLLLTVRVHRRPPEKRESPWTDFRDGLHHLRTRRSLVPLVIVIGLSEMCFSGPVGIGLVLFVNERHWNASTLGWILSAFSVGGAASALLFSAIRVRKSAGLVMSLCMVITAILVTAIGLVSVQPLAIGVGALLGFSSGCTMVLSNALVQKEAEPQYLGRVTAVTTFCTLGLSPLLFPLTGLITARWGSGVFFAVCGGICAAAAIISAWRLRAAQL